MSRLTDRLTEIEDGLARNLGDTAPDLLSRRLVLRKALETYGKERYDEGHQDGMRDALDTRYEASRLAAERNGGGGDGSH